MAMILLAHYILGPDVYNHTYNDGIMIAWARVATARQAIQMCTIYLHPWQKKETMSRT